MLPIKINKKLSFDIKKPPLIVAEISANHGGIKNRFLEHIKVAAKSGADLVKIQSYEPNDITVNSNNKIFKIKNGIWKNQIMYKLYQKACTPFEWHADAFKLAKKLGVTLFSTPFSVRSVDLLEKLNVPIYKLASLEITDFNLISKIAKTKKPIIISTGCANLDEIQNCINLIRKRHNKIILLHSVSKYPTKESESNIKRINVLKKKFKGLMIGLSDHTTNINSSIAATTLGVVMIEKHFIIDKKSKTEDRKFSINARELLELKNSTFKIFNILNAKLVNNTPNKSFRRSLYAIKFIKKGEKINKTNLVALRPFVGICASNYFRVLGKIAKKNILQYSPIKKTDLNKKL